MDTLSYVRLEGPVVASEKGSGFLEAFTLLYRLWGRSPSRPRDSGLGLPDSLHLSLRSPQELFPKDGNTIDIHIFCKV